MRILVVDDEQDICEIVQYNLELEGYEVATANSAEEALGLDLTSYDLLLLDVMMGGMSGFDLARQLKEDPKTAATVQFLSAYFSRYFGDFIPASLSRCFPSAFRSRTPLPSPCRAS